MIIKLSNFTPKILFPNEMIDMTLVQNKSLLAWRLYRDRERINDMWNKGHLNNGMNVD